MEIFWDTGQANLLLDKGVPFPGPVRLIHGDADDVVPWNISVRLMAALGSEDVKLLLIKGADHNLSREADVATIVRAAVALLESLPS